MANTSDEKNSEAALIEYESLRAEILKRQQARDAILGFTIAALGVILGILFDFGGNGTELGFSVRLVALLSLSFVLLIGAVLFTIHHTQQIDVISGFIRYFIEPHVEGISWESRWTRLRAAIKGETIKSGLPLGTSKYFARYYLLLTFGLLALAGLFRVYENCWALIVILSLFVVCCILEHNLFARWSRGWKINWEAIRKSEVEADRRTKTKNQGE